MIPEQLRGETSHKEHEASNVSKHLVTSIGQKLKNDYHGSVMDDDIDDDDTGVVSLRCLSLYTRGGGCKVGATTSDEFGEVVGKGYKPGSGTDDTSVDCFSYGVDRLWKRNNRKKSFEIEESHGNNTMHVFLPDDILEFCFMRLPLTSLMNTRLVCKKWRSLTMTPRFMQMRREGYYPSPWLFLFGTVTNGLSSREIYAFDVSFNKWHKVEAEILKNRFLFSVATVHDNIFIVGGCSSSGRMDRKTHRGVLVFSPMTKSWNKVASMKHARSKSVLGVFEANSDRLTIKSQLRTRTRIGGVSDVYGDPHRISVRRTSRNEKTKHTSSVKDRGRFLIIAVGGIGSWDEALNSCEIFDSSSNKWTEIQRLPVDFGVVCSGVVCDGVFYVYSETDKLAAYDIGHGLWTRVQSTPHPPRVHEYTPRLVSCDGQRLYLVSVSWCEGEGEIGRRNKAVRKLWELDLDYLTWNEVSVHPDAPMDWNSLFVADKNLIFGIEMFKIFGQVMEFLTMCDVSNPKMKWVHASKNQVAREMDVSSCMLKSMAVVHL